MARPVPSWPPAELAARLLAGLRAEDRATATRDFAAAFLDPLTAYLEARFPNAPPDLAATAAGDALLDTCQHPDRFDPGRGDLAAYLRMAARRDLLNLLRRERRHSGRAVSLPDDVEDRSVGGNCIREDDARPRWDDPRIAAVMSRLRPGEQQAVELMRDGVRAVAAFAAPLGVGHLSGPDLARAVKRFKDRVVKQLRRAVGG